MTAQDIIDALVSSVGDSIWATELAFSGTSRRCDFWTLSPNSSAGFLARAFEVKVSRADFKKDTAIKQREARLFSDRFYYATPAGLIHADEVPDWAGLCEIADGKVRYKIHAPHRDKDAPSWELVASLIRNSGQVRRDTDSLKKQLQWANAQLKEASKRCQDLGIQPWNLGLQ